MRGFPGLTHKYKELMPRTAARIAKVPAEVVEHRIYLIRGFKVMIDSDLAKLYRVPTSRLNQAVRRNRKRFPRDFMFQLSAEEVDNLRLQFVISSSDWGGRRYRCYAFTEHGVAMLSAVLRSRRAVEMSILVVRAFVRLREMIASNKDMAARVTLLENNQEQHAELIGILFDELKAMKLLPPGKTRFGFRTT